MKQGLKKMATIVGEYSIKPVVAHGIFQNIRSRRKSSRATATSGAASDIHHATTRCQIIHILTFRRTVWQKLHFVWDLQQTVLHSVQKLMTESTVVLARGCNFLPSVATVRISSKNKEKRKIKSENRSRKRARIDAKTRKTGQDKVKPGTVIKEEVQITTNNE